MKILIIKLGAMGDVLRTTPLLTAFKKKYPQSRITWLVDSKCEEVLQDNPLIDQLLSYSEKSLLHLKKEHFDKAVNLDKDAEALDAIMGVEGDEKLGFGRLENGTLGPLNVASDYATRLGTDDDLKFRQNKKTYQEIVFEQVGFHFSGEEYVFSIPEKDFSFAKKHLKALGAGADAGRDLRVGLNTGSGSRFAGKKLPIETYLKLIEKFSSEMRAVVFLLGGEDEIERNRQIQKASRVPVINTGSHSIKRFASIVRECDLVVSGDTTAMHIAIAVKVPVVAYFASTCATEIELYGRGKKIISDISCAPCYLKDCPIDEQCMKEMRADKIFDMAKEALQGVQAL